MTIESAVRNRFFKTSLSAAGNEKILVGGSHFIQTGIIKTL